MKATLLALMLAAGAGAAHADDAYWPRQNSTILAQTEPHSSMIDAQRKAGEADRRATVERVTNAGGCNADDMPFWIYQHCSRQTFGNPMGSEGGSE